MNRTNNFWALWINFNSLTELRHMLIERSTGWKILLAVCFPIYSPPIQRFALVFPKQLEQIDIAKTKFDDLFTAPRA